MYKDNIAIFWTYDLYGPLCNAFDAGKSITRARGRGLGPGNRDFLGSVNTLGMLLTKRSTFTKRTKSRIRIHISTSLHTANKRTEGGHPRHAAHKEKYVHSACEGG
jgi:hypothetical protein